jgi:predicted nucleic acid-binding protein
MVDDVVAGGAMVPGLWRLEVANVLRTVLRRGQLSLDQRDAALVALSQWPVTVDDETDQRAWTDTLRLADRFGLTPYDAAYLELASRRGLPLATLDRELMVAAPAAGVRLSGGRPV